MRKLLVVGLSLSLLLLCSPLVSAQEEEAAIYTITINYEVQNLGDYEALNARVLIVLFDNVSGWANQEVLSESITLDGAVIYPQIFDEVDNRWTSISIGNLGAGESKTISVTQVLRVSAVDLSIDPSQVGTAIPPELAKYTQPVDGLFESDDPAIQQLAQQLTEDTTNIFIGTGPVQEEVSLPPTFYSKARQIFDYLMDNLTYERQTTEHSALWALLARKGDCTEFSNLFIALARAAGIPAKAVAGYAYLALYNPSEIGGDTDNLGHAYSIFYLPNYGWVPADAVWPQYIGSFGEMDYAHIVGATTGGEGVVGAQGQIAWRYPGYIGRNWEYYSGEPTTLGGPTSGTITPEVLVDISLSMSPQIENDQLTLTATVKNLGRSLASGLTAEIEANPAYFDVITSPQQKDSLASGEQWTTSFVVQLKDGAYENRHVFTSMVSYDSSYGDISETFLAGVDVSVQIPAKPTAPQQGYDIMLYVLVGVLVAVVAVVAVVLARR